MVFSDKECVQTYSFFMIGAGGKNLIYKNVYWDTTAICFSKSFPDDCIKIRSI